MNFLKYYYQITNSKFSNERVEGFPKVVTKGSRLFTIILLYTLIILSLVVSLFCIIQKQSGYWVLIAPVLFYILLLSSCNFSMIQFLVLYILVHTRNQYVKLLYSYYYNYNFSQELIIKSNRLVKKCALYSELHKTLFKAIYQVDFGRKEKIFITLKWNKILIEHNSINHIIDKKTINREMLIDEIISLIKTF